MPRRIHPERKVKVELDGGDDIELELREILAPPGEKISLSDYDPGYSAGYKDKQGARKKLAANIRELASLQDRLYARGTWSVLVIFQALDAAGKDGAIKHVMSGVNPQGCHVVSFKQPTSEELEHDYLRRASRSLPANGHIGIFNRSYYEEVLVVRVHPELLDKQKLPASKLKGIWKRRFREINAFERYLTDNGIVVLKFFLNISKEEQRQRFLARIDRPEKNWKFSDADIEERGHWDAYMKAYEETFRRTSTQWAPWFIVPADKKWFTRLIISEAIVHTLRNLHLTYPEVSEERRRKILGMKKLLEEVDG
jgi:PPK2 family polyphosphate:nucleotide phosphotransferase